MRTARTLVLAFALIALAAPLAPPVASPLQPAIATTTERPPDEGSAAAPHGSSSEDGSGTSVTGLLVALGLGAVATMFVGRWYFRVRTWLRMRRPV
jgi:hypothetical protein